MSGLTMKYFVLKPAGDSPYHQASRMAMHAYADSIEKENPKLASELRDWIGREVAEHFQRTDKTSNKKR